MRSFLFSICLVYSSLAASFVPALAQSTATTLEVEKQRLLVQARLSADTPVLDEGVEWRIFGSTARADGDFPELGSAQGGSAAFNIEPGEYVIHASFGYAGAVKKIRIGVEAAAEEFILNAGGFRLSATTTDNAPIPRDMLKFDIFEQDIQENGDRNLVGRDIKPGEIVALPVGTYHVVSRFGELNASVRADLHVEAGKLTEASLQHRAAILSFRLVRVNGGDAVVDTAWSILTENGEVIRESNSTFPSMVLAEGDYTAIVKHNERIYSEDFTVRSGFHRELEVVIPN